ncbi:DUF1847 domain-containing protein [Cloacibacillus porcorum]|uniref:Uncharacterized protein n=3 Tax=Cloacibacillus porcorum TaxID=1197717 RepID=A0A1B2I3J4_9BACT|nr:DUF1847 domain-containing protein [Cloacibacillus porcorum]ANZ44503.1 hypothetical protein BED41_05020 [Cloacibacillus porcorum]MCC8183183.1 DUF1847 domain-containing protein [Cloacibacillus porcorum]MCI5865574.1 DUF1847 domain-containing protein [Cloacibacillus porcorum]MDY5390545.1 DUF1847 domain-containing protein [Cloacibacillus porcorum]NMF18656.1 DUF1847 domain-containing protein [Cloacibacillus porcorum]
MRCDRCTEKPCREGMACTACDAAALYADPEDRRMMRAASEVEAEYYGEINRIQEIILFSQKMGYKKLGIAFCAALSEEAAKLSQILENYFEISTVNCKVCGVEKSEMGAMESDKVGPISCNPIEQAEVLNAANTDLNLLLGLCVGHDALFIKYSQAPVVPVAAKDRVIAHNPLGALYCSAIFKRMMKEAKNQETK